MTLQDLVWSLKKFQLDNDLILHHYSINIELSWFDVEFVSTWTVRHEFRIPKDFSGNLTTVYFEPALTLID